MCSFCLRQKVHSRDIRPGDIYLTALNIYIYKISHSLYNIRSKMVYRAKRNKCSLPCIVTWTLTLGLKTIKIELTMMSWS